MYKNHITLARDDTLAHRAPDDILAALSALYSLAIPNIPPDSQRAFNQVALYGVRGSYPFILSAVEALLSHLATTVSATLTPHTNPYLTAPEIDDSWSDRLIRFEGQLYHSLNYDSNTSRLYLTTARAQNITPAPQAGAVQAGAASLLPFTISEPQPDSLLGANVKAPCEVIIDVIAPSLQLAPPSYLRSGGDPRTNDLYGAHIMDIYSPTENEREGDQTTGPYPLYLPGDEFDTQTRALLEALLAAGVRLSMRLQRTF